MKIVWNRVTPVSQTVAIVLFVGVFLLAFYLGRSFEKRLILGEPINDVTFVCAEGRKIDAEFYKHSVRIILDEGRDIYLPQTISGSGARYANQDESFVFWNKGDTAFITEGDPNTPTYKDCSISK